jgi:hypothetical protein
MPTFILNDETQINSYGFRVPNKGGDFNRFDKNPVMLNSHVNTTESVLGNWVKRVIVGNELKADTNFDNELDSVKVVEGQVNRGFVKGASIGITFNWESMEKAPDGVWELKQWELLEASICAVPSNANALALYTPEGELIPEGEIKLAMQKLSAEKITKPNKNEMEKFNLSAPALAVLVGFGLSNQNSEAEINAAVVALNAALTKEKGTVATLQTELDKQVKLQATALVDLAVKEERLLAGEREDFIQLATSNYELATKLINARPAKQTLTTDITNPLAGAEVKSIDDFEKLTDEKKLAYKSAHPDAYKALFAKKS